MSTTGRPLQLILARNLLASLHTPAFIIDAPGQIPFYNESAAAILGRRFEESGPLSAEEWTTTFGPFGDDGKPLSYHEIGLTQAAYGNHAAHERMRIRSVQGTEYEIEASVLPLVGDDGFHGAMVFFWPVGEGAS
jgi:hypothetical protein